MIARGGGKIINTCPPMSEARRSLRQAGGTDRGRRLLASRASNFVNGQVIDVDGGVLAAL